MGSKESESGTVSVRSQEKQDVQEVLPLEAFVARVAAEAAMSF